MNGALLPALACGAALLFTIGPARGQKPYQSSADFSKYAEKLRESATLHLEPQVTIATNSRILDVSGKYPWKTNIVTTVFWVGHTSGKKGLAAPSAWDPKWEQSYGGFDSPEPGSRHNFLPAAFVPRENPFYIALPYNDVTGTATKPEAKVVIPWFREAADAGHWQEGQSVCRDRWIAIRSSAGKVCYAQWSDCGPFRTDHWQYVFGNERPMPNSNGGAGLNVSPAVRDYLDLQSTNVTDWKFVEVANVPNGPWSLYGENNPLAQKAHHPPQSASPPPVTEPTAPPEFTPNHEPDRGRTTVNAEPCPAPIAPQPPP